MFGQRSYGRGFLIIIAVLFCVVPQSIAAQGLGGGLEVFEKLQNRITEISQELQPGVVHINSILRQNKRNIEVTGSGIIADARGYILTNHHIIDNAQEVTITLSESRRKYSAKILGSDRQTDLALLKIETDELLKFPRFGNSDEVKVGEWVLAIGNPFGLDGTVSFGIISAKGRNFNFGALLNEYIQTDAMIDRGSSGGPLVNLRGEVIGINSMGQGRGIGFTIPMNTVLEIKEKLLDEGKIERGWLGITMQPLSRDLADYFKMPDQTGVIVNSVAEGSPAEVGGLKAGDVITEFDGKRVEAEDEKDLARFTRMIAKTKVGEKVSLAIMSGGEKRIIDVKVGEQPSAKDMEEEFDLGFNVREITNDIYLTNRLQTRRGVFVSFVEKGSIAGIADLKPGDVIQTVRESEVGDIEQLKLAMQGMKEKARILLKVARGKEMKYILFKASGGENSQKDFKKPVE